MTWRTFIAYDKDYPVLFDVEKQRLQTTLGNVMVEHFGSTAVPDLGGKGYIDIYMAVSKQEMEKFSSRVQRLGYEHRPDGDIPGERLFHKRKIVTNSGKAITYNLHITYLGSENFKMCMALRDYLRQHPKEAQNYAEVKKKATLKANKKTDKKSAVAEYMSTKDGLVKELTDRALAWHDNQINRSF